MYGNPETTTGGRALKFFASMRIDVRKGELLKNSSGEFIGAHTKVKIVKNKVAPPFKTAEFDIMYGEGISKLGELIDIAAEYDIMKKSGAWYSYNGEKLGQGKDNTKQFLRTNPDVADEIEALVRAELKKRTGAAAKPADDEGTSDAIVPSADKRADAISRAEAKAMLDITVDDDE